MTREGGCVQLYSISYNLCRYDPARKAQPRHQGPLTNVSSRLLRTFGIPTAIDFHTISKFFRNTLLLVCMSYLYKSIDGSTGHLGRLYVKGCLYPHH
jgi:hypothetical protein